MKRVLPVLLFCLLTVGLLVQPVLAFDGQPPETPQDAATPVAMQAPVRTAPAWLGILLVFVLPFAYMIFKSWGKKDPDMQPPGADLPVLRDGDRPFRIYDDEDEKP